MLFRHDKAWVRIGLLHKLASWTPVLRPCCDSRMFIRGERRPSTTDRGDFTTATTPSTSNKRQSHPTLLIQANQFYWIIQRNMKHRKHFQLCSILITICMKKC